MFPLIVPVCFFPFSHCTVGGCQLCTAAPGFYSPFLTRRTHLKEIQKHDLCGMVGQVKTHTVGAITTDRHREGASHRIASPSWESQITNEAVGVM